MCQEYNAIGLFDGAGGADDIGSPRLAARLACEAVKQYFRLGGGDVSEALQGAREAIKMLEFVLVPLCVSLTGR